MNNLNSNTNNFGFIQQPVTVSDQGLMNMPAPMPANAQFVQPTMPMGHFAQPLIMSQPQIVQPAPLIINAYENVQSNTDFWVYTPNGLVQANVAQYCIPDGQGNYISPSSEWTIMPMAEYYKLNLNIPQFPSNVEPLAPIQAPSVASASASRSQSVESNVLSVKDVNTQIATESKNNPVKRPHRSKQMKIDKSHAELEETCRQWGVLADDNEVLRGEDVTRTHVKTWEGLDLIHEVLEEINDTIPIARIALPISMKNPFQKKGYICYLQVQNLEDVSVVQSIFAQYPVAFKKCDIALPSNKESVPAPVEKHTPVDKITIPFNFGAIEPPTLARKGSAA